MTGKLTRRDWLVGTSAVAGGVMLGSSASAQDMGSIINMGAPISPENPIRMTIMKTLMVSTQRR